MKRIWLIVLILLLVAAYQTFGAEPQTNPERDPGAFRKTGGTISGDVVMQQNLDVTGLATFTDAYFTHIDSAGAIEAAGTIIANSGIEVVGDMLASGTIWADAAAILGDLGVIGTLGVTGTATFSDDIHAESDFFLAGNASFTVPVPVAGGGTGGTTAEEVRDNLSLPDNIEEMTSAASTTLVTDHIASTGTAVHGLGSLSTQNANSISVTGGVATLTSIECSAIKVAAGGIVTNTADGADSSYAYVSGGSALSGLRGPNIQLFGNEHAQAGNAFIDAGASTSASIIFRTSPTSAVERMRIAANGNVGIGTATPQNTLSVAGGNIGLSNETAIVRETVDGADNSGFSLSGGGATGGSRGAYIQLYGNEHATASGSIQIAAGSNTGGHIKFVTNAANRMWITDAGYVGISTTTPQTPLHVVGNARVDGENYNYLVNEQDTRVVFSRETRCAKSAVDISVHAASATAKLSSIALCSVSMVCDVFCADYIGNAALYRITGVASWSATGVLSTSTPVVTTVEALAGSVNAPTALWASTTSNIGLIITNKQNYSDMHIKVRAISVGGGGITP